MRAAVAIVGIMMVGAQAHAEAALPPDVMALQRKVERAQTAAVAVQAELQRVRAREKTYDATLRTLVQTQLALGGLSPLFWQVRSVLTDTPETPGLVAAVLRANARALVQAQRKNSRLTVLYAQSQAKVAELQSLSAAFAKAREHLRYEERGMLATAGVDADTLAAQLEQALVARNEEEALAPPVRKPQIMVEESAAPAKRLRRWPVAGRLVQGFKQGRGATAMGVVLQGGPQAQVLAPVGGDVLYAGPFRVFGGIVILKTPGELYTLLGGFSTLNVNAGATVEAGQVLGGLEETGRLYWEARQGKRVVNPLR